MHQILTRFYGVYIMPRAHVHSVILHLRALFSGLIRMSYAHICSIRNICSIQYCREGFGKCLLSHFYMRIIFTFRVCVHQILTGFEGWTKYWLGCTIFWLRFRGRSPNSDGSPIKKNLSYWLPVYTHLESV